MYFTHKEWQFCFQSFLSFNWFSKNSERGGWIKVIFCIGVLGYWGKVKHIFYDKGEGVGGQTNTKKMASFMNSHYTIRARVG